MLKKGLCLLLAIVLVFTLSGCADTLKNIVGSMVFIVFTALNDDRADKDEIFEFVTEHEEALLQAVEAKDFTDFESQGIVKDVHAEMGVVEFSCGGAGLVPSSAYVGFYYTADHDMAALWCAPQSAGSLKPSGNGYLWQEKSGDNRYYTEHICGNFYYYAASF